MENVLVMWDNGSGVCHTVFGGHAAFPAVFPSFVGRPLVVPALIVANGGGTCYAGFCSCVCFSRCVPFCRRQAQGARHHGRYRPEGQFCWVVFAGDDSTRAVLPWVV